MKSDRNRICLLAAWIVVCAGLSLGAAQAAEGDASVRGILYVSYPGDLSYDVMFGKDVEVWLLRGEKSLENEVDSLKAKRLPEIRNQQAIALKAYGAVKRITSKEIAKLKERRETLERESAKLTKLRSDYEKEFVAILDKNAIQRTRTNSEGKFSFTELSPGRYLLHAQFEIPGTVNRYFWLHPAEAKEKEDDEVHLNKKATIHLYDEK